MNSLCVALTVVLAVLTVAEGTREKPVRYRDITIPRHYSPTPPAEPSPPRQRRREKVRQRLPPDNTARQKRVKFDESNLNSESKWRYVEEEEKNPTFGKLFMDALVDDTPEAWTRFGQFLPRKADKKDDKGDKKGDKKTDKKDKNTAGDKVYGDATRMTNQRNSVRHRRRTDNSDGGKVKRRTNRNENDKTPKKEQNKDKNKNGGDAEPTPSPNSVKNVSPAAKNPPNQNQNSDEPTVKIYPNYQPGLRRKGETGPRPPPISFTSSSTKAAREAPLPHENWPSDSFGTDLVSEYSETPGSIEGYVCPCMSAEKQKLVLNANVYAFMHLPDMMRRQIREDNLLGGRGVSRVYLINDIYHKEKLAMKCLGLHSDKEKTSASIEMYFMVMCNREEPHILGMHQRYITTMPNEMPVRLGVCYTTDYAPHGNAEYFMSNLDEHFSPQHRELFVKFIARDVLTGLSRMHVRGHTHGDLKASSVLIFPTKAVLANFSQLRRLIRNSPKCPTYELDVIEHLSPEYLGYHGQCTYDHRSDIWMVGVLVFKLLVGYNPFTKGDTNLSRDQIIHSIFSGVVELPKTLSDAATKFIAETLLPRSDRIQNSGDALDHSWFDDIREFKITSESQSPFTLYSSPSATAQLFDTILEINKLKQTLINAIRDENRLPRVSKILELMKGENPSSGHNNDKRSGRNKRKSSRNSNKSVRRRTDKANNGRKRKTGKNSKK